MASSMVGTGQRNRQVTIQQLTEAKGDSGEPIESWTTLCTMFCSLEAVDAPERFTEGTVMDQISARAWIRFTGPYRADCDPLRVAVTKKRRIVYLGRTYDIAAAEQLGFQRQITFLTLSKVG